MNGASGNIIRAMRGPLTLITVGVLFAFNNFTPYGFEKTWPVLLIVFGLLTLIGRGVGPAPAPPYPPQTPPPPYNYYQQQGAYRQSTYSQPPAADASAQAGTAKGGFGTTAPGRSTDPGQQQGGTA